MDKEIEHTMTTKQVADGLGTTPNVITETGKKLFPNKVIENGKPTMWSEKEVTLILDHLNSNSNRTDLPIRQSYRSSTTSLTPTLNLAKATAEFQNMVSGLSDEDTDLACDAIAAMSQSLILKLRADKKRAVKDREHDHLLVSCKYKTASEIGDELGISAIKIGKIAKQLGLQDKDTSMDLTMNKPCQTDTWTGQQFVYSPVAQDMIKTELIKSNNNN